MCAEHGNFSTIIWRGDGELDYSAWEKEKLRAHPQVCLTEVEKDCPYDCGICAEHRQQTCCVVLEVTERCNLNCNFCFASSGGEKKDSSFEQIREWLEHLVEAGKPFIHLSGGEPTVRNDLPEIISLANQMGFPYIQLNTNGLRLSLDPEYVRRLKEAGLSSVFMQFDGTRDEIYLQLKGRSLLAVKDKAIQNCSDNHLGIVLVPTIVPGVNAVNIWCMKKLWIMNLLRTVRRSLSGPRPMQQT
ncbi:MAG: radical SAM protein [Candidatus Dehalobacter alkaniphilus]|nr:radical SAM protein [Dehalobacter sp. DCM]